MNKKPARQLINNLFQMIIKSHQEGNNNNEEKKYNCQFRNISVQ